MAYHSDYGRYKSSQDEVMLGYASRECTFDPYSAKDNYLTSVLPSKYNSSYLGTSSRDMSSLRNRPVLTTNTKKQSSAYNPHKYSSYSSTYTSSSADIVRPATRAKKAPAVADHRHAPGASSFLLTSRADSFSSSPTSSAARSRSKPRLERETIRVARGARSPSVPRRRTCASGGTLSSSDAVANVLSRSYASGSVSSKKEPITIEKVPYAHHYEPSFARSDSPKRTPESLPLYSDSSKRSAVTNFESGSRARPSPDSSSSSSHVEASRRSGCVSRDSYTRDIGSGTTGLRNIGNTCFMNSILQCLSNTEPLRKYCFEQRYIEDLNKDCSPMKGKLMTAFAEVVKELWKPNAISVSPNHFKAQIQKFSPRFMGYEQQDSQEFLRFLLEGLHEDINKVRVKSKDPLPSLSGKSARERARATWRWYATKDQSFIFDLFVGQLESSLKCTECNHVSLTYDPFWDLSLPISKTAYPNESTSIRDCLKTFTKEETLDRDEKPTCERCKVRRRMVKKMVIHKFPKVLVLHLKRFHEGSRYRQKLNNKVDFPLRGLHLDSYASDDCENPASCVYDLYAVSNHCGSCYGGHYTAYCYNSELKDWYEFNDSQVTKASSGSVCTKEAYVLFYTQRDPSARL